MPPLPSYSRKESCFSAVLSVSGWNQCVVWVAPWESAHFFMPAATSSAIVLVSGLPLSMQSVRARKVSGFKYSRIFLRSKTRSPKYSEAGFSGALTSMGFLLKEALTA